MADPGFLRQGAPAQEWVCKAIILLKVAKNCMKVKEIVPGGGGACIHSTSLEPNTLAVSIIYAVQPVSRIVEGPFTKIRTIRGTREPISQL